MPHYPVRVGRGFIRPYQAGDSYHGGKLESETSLESQVYFGTMEKGPTDQLHADQIWKKLLQVQYY